MKKSKKAIKRKSSTKKVKSKKNSDKDKIVVVNFDVEVCKGVISDSPDVAKSFMEIGISPHLKLEPPLKIIPKEIIKHIHKIKNNIIDYLFYHMYINCDQHSDKRCPYCECKNILKKHKVSFNSNKKLFVVEMIPPKKANYKDIDKTIKHSVEGLGYSIMEAGYDNTLYKIKNQYYDINWKFKNMVIPDYYKK